MRDVVFAAPYLFKFGSALREDRCLRAVFLLPLAARTGRWHFRATRSMCVRSPGYRLSSAMERPSPGEGLQGLSKHASWRPSIKMPYKGLLQRVYLSTLGLL